MDTMVSMNRNEHDPRDAVAGPLAALGQRLRLARQRRHITAKELAEQVGITRVTLRRVERGEPAVMMGTYLKVMMALGLANDLQLLAADDHQGLRRQSEDRIRLSDFPQLQALGWGTCPQASVSAEEAFALYERNWRHLDLDAMDAKEKGLVARLTATVGKGVLLV